MFFGTQTVGINIAGQEQNLLANSVRLEYAQDDGAKYLLHNTESETDL
jgi:hypothetical protein